MILSAWLIGATVVWQPEARGCDDEQYYYDEWIAGTYDYWDGDYFCHATLWESLETVCQWTPPALNCTNYRNYWQDEYCEYVEPVDPCEGESCSACEGENPFNVYDGNARREVKELELPGTSRAHFNWTRFHNTVPRLGQAALGQGGSWRHSWQFELTLLPARNGHRASCDFISPAGMRRNFVHADDGKWRPAARFPERLEEVTDGFDLITGSGVRLHFVAVAGDGPEGRRYEMRILTDSHGLETRLDYDDLGNVTKVTDPAGRFFEVTYRDIPQQKRFERKLAWLDSVAPGADGWVEVVVPAWFAQHQAFRYLRCVTSEGVAADVAEAQYFAPGASQPLTGAMIDAGTTLDLGVARNIARVRVRPKPSASLVGVTVSGLDARPASARVLMGVRASDGRRVDYAYETVKDPAFSFEYPALTQARYGDGTTARYRYRHTATAAQPLLVEADDPRYDGRAKRIQYAYRQDQARGLGFIHHEINPATGGVYASLELDPSNPDKRIVHYSDLRSVSYLTPEATNGRPTERVDALGRKTRFEYGDAGRLRTRIDHAGRRTEFSYDEHGLVRFEQREARVENQIFRDSTGRKKSSTDRYGRVTAYERNAFGRVTRFTGPDGGVREFSYDTLGHLITFKQRDGGLHVFAYNERGLKTSWTDQKGNVTRYGYDTQDRRISVTDPIGRVTRREVDERGQTTKVIHPDGTTEAFTYDDYGRTTASTNRLGRTTKFSYDELGRKVREEDAIGHVTTFDYTELPQGCGSCTLVDQPSRVVGPDGVVTSLLYDAEGRLLARTVATGTAAEATTLYAYDNDDNLVSQTDPLGAVTRFTYDDEHHRLTATDPLGRVTHWAYDGHGNMTGIIAPDGGITLSEYDAQDRLIKTTDAAGNVTRREYDAFGNLITLTDATGKITRHTYDGKRRTSTQFPDGKRQTWEYDTVGRPVRETSADGVVTTTSYDLGNRPTQVGRVIPNAPSGSTAYTYDAVGRRVSVTDPLGRITRWTYDAAGNVLAEIRPDGLQTSHTYDSRNRRTSTTDPAGNTTRFEYDSADNQTALTDARGNTYRFTYDARHRKTAMVYPDGSQETWAYDLQGKLAGYATRAGQTKTFAYNAGGLPVGETWLPAGTAPDVAYAYDAAGRLTMLDNGRAKLAYTYDALGRMTSETSDLSAIAPGLATQTVRYGFDALGRRSDLTYPDGTKVSYDYDTRGRLKSVNDGPGRAVGRYDYDPLGRIAKLTRDNNVVTTYAYDMAGQLTDIAHTHGNNVLAGSHYALDNLGRRTAQTREDNITESYAYDATGQLTGVDYGTGRSEGFAYDLVGNRLATSEITNPQSPIKENAYTTNALNQYTHVGGVPFAYDQNGNLVDDGKQHYTYDAQNRLITVEPSVLSASSAGNIRAEFFYDARNRCVLRKYYTLGSQGQWVLNQSDSRALTYDAKWNLLAERTLNGAQAGQYIHGLRTDEILQWTGSDGAKLCPLADALGSTVALSDRQGRVTERYRYSAYGTPQLLFASYLPATSPSLSTQFRFCFTGREWLDIAGLQDNRNRLYSASMGRWPTGDPIRFRAGDINIYRYVRNDPMQYSDPSGRISYNQTVCDGNGGFTFTLQYPSAADADCTRQHEQQHILDYQSTPNFADACIGVPAGQPPQVTGVTQAEVDSFVNRTECNAYTVGFYCRSSLIGTISNPQACNWVKTYLNNDYIQISRYCSAAL